jgi:hypothetical protein
MRELIVKENDHLCIPYGVCFILNADYEFDLSICVVHFTFSDSFSGVDMGPFSCTKSGGAELGGK